MDKSVHVTALIIFQYHMKMRFLAEVNLKSTTVFETTVKHKLRAMALSSVESEPAIVTVWNFLQLWNMAEIGN